LTTDKEASRDVQYYLCSELKAVIKQALSRLTR